MTSYEGERSLKGEDTIINRLLGSEKRGSLTTDIFILSCVLLCWGNGSPVASI